MDDNQEAWSASTVYVQKGDGVSGEDVRVDCKQRGNEQSQPSETEGGSGYLGKEKETGSGAGDGSGYLGREKETWSGVEGRSVQKRALESRA